MDENKIDWLIQAKLFEAEGVNHPVSGWEQVSSQLLPAGKNWLTNWQSRMVLIGGAFLLIINLVLLGIVIHQQQSLENISTQLKAFEGKQVLNRSIKDESSLIRKFVPITPVQSNNSENTTSLSKLVARHRRSDPDQQSVTMLARTIPSPADEKILERESQTHDSHSQHLFEPDVPKQDVMERIESANTLPNKQSNQGGPIADKTDSLREPAIQGEVTVSTASHKRSKSRRSRHGRKPLWKGWELQTGITISLPRAHIDFGLTPPGTGANVGMGIQFLAPGDRLRLETGVEYASLTYKTDDHLNAATIAEKFANYPNLNRYGNLDKLHEIDMEAQLLQIPVRVKYMLTDDRSVFRPWLGAGLVGRFFLNEDFVYEFEDVAGEDVIFSERGGSSRSFGTGELSLGGEYAFSKKVKGQLAFIYRLDFTQQGIEKRSYQFWGMQVGISHNWGKKKR